MGKTGKSPLVAIFVFLVIGVSLYYFMTTNGETKDTIGTLIYDYPNGKVVFDLPPPPPQIQNLTAQMSYYPYNYFLKSTQSASQSTQTLVQSGNQQGYNVSSSSVVQTAGTPLNKSSTSYFTVNGQQSSLLSPSTTLVGLSNTNVPVYQLGQKQPLNIVAKVDLMNPITKVRSIPPYTWVMQLVCTSTWCNNDNMPTPRGHTDNTGTMTYPFYANENIIVAGDYTAKITFMSEDKDQIQVEADYPFTIIPSSTK